MRIIFRADGSRQLGLGHVVRCLTLADELRKRDSTCKIVFITKYEEGRHIVQTRGYRVAGPQPDEIMQVKEMVSGGALLITDFLDTDDAYTSRIKSSSDIRVIAIDNNTRLKKLAADVVINANVFDEPETRAIGTTRYFLGPKYVILRREFGRERTNKKEVRDKARMIIVLAGGGDLAGGHLILNSVEALDGIDKEVHIGLVIGPTFPYRIHLDELLARASRRFEVHDNPPNLADLMQNADLAITAAGTVLYELACLGVPAIAVPTVTPSTRHQEDIARNFERRGACMNLGHSPDNRLLLERTILLLEDKPWREYLSTTGKDLVDAGGLDRALGMISEACTVAG